MKKLLVLCFLVLAGNSPTLHANNKVVVIPLGGDTIVDPQPFIKSLSYPASALNYPTASSIIRKNSRGLRWGNDFSHSAKLAIHRPRDWTLTSPVTLRLFLRRLNSDFGGVQFFARGRDFNPGSPDADAPSVSSATNTTFDTDFFELTIEFPASQLQREWWEIVIQRNSTAIFAYESDVIVHSVELSYEAQH